MITAERLRKVLSYRPDTGIFIWLISTGSRAVVGQKAGKTQFNERRIKICVDGTQYMAHRLAWLYVHGKWPKHQIDHIDGDGFNNRIYNLRDATRSINQQNLKRAQKNNNSGYLGASPVSKKLADGSPCKRWFARIMVNGNIKYLGMFDSPRKAHEAYLSAKRILHIGNTL